MTFNIEVVIDANSTTRPGVPTTRSSIEALSGGLMITTASRETAARVFSSDDVDIFIVTAPTHVWTSTTLATITGAFAEDPALDLLFGPETSREVTIWSPERLRRSDFLGGVIAISGRLARQLVGIRTEFYPYHRWDLALRAVERTTSIRVASRPLAERVTTRPPLTNPECVRRGRQVLSEHLSRCEITAEIDATPEPGRFELRRTAAPSVRPSIVIASMASNYRTPNDQSDGLQRILSRLSESDSTSAVETLVITTSSMPGSEALRLRQFGGATTEVLPLCRESSMKWRYLEVAAGHVTGDVVIVLDDDVVIESADWLTRMVALAMDPRIGAVTANEAPVDASRPTTRTTRATPSGCIAMRRELFSRLSGLLDDTTGKALPVLLRRRGLASVTTDHVRFRREHEFSRATPVPA